MKIKQIAFIFTILSMTGLPEIFAQNTDGELVKQLIAKKRNYNKEKGYGFRIQLSNGNEIDIKKTRELFALEYPTIASYILFESPEWKVQVGDFRTNLEADKALNIFRKKFRGAIVVPR
ncbi:SPOR domain-containing protein [Polaribacter pacificus]|nr:SPOR domain-containing protein [Polaribacter pacificus]